MCSSCTLWLTASKLKGLEGVQALDIGSFCFTLLSFLHGEGRLDQLIRMQQQF